MLRNDYAPRFFGRVSACPKDIHLLTSLDPYRMVSPIGWYKQFLCTILFFSEFQLNALQNVDYRFRVVNHKRANEAFHQSLLETEIRFREFAFMPLSKIPRRIQ